MNGALHHRGEADVVSDHQLVHRLHLEAAAFAVGGVDALKVPALQDEHVVIVVIEGRDQRNYPLGLDVTTKKYIYSYFVCARMCKTKNPFLISKTARTNLM